MEPKLRYRAELALPTSTVHITSTNFEKVKEQVRTICKAENIQPKFSSNTENTIFITGSSDEPLGELVTYATQNVNVVGQQKAA